MVLARITLDSGLGIELASLQISSTYDVFLEGYPNARTNDMLLERLAKRRQYTCHSRPAHLIAPPRTYPEPAQGSGQLPFGPVEVLPPIYCEGTFRSHCISGELDPVLHRSWLVVTWFQDDLSAAVSDFVTAAVRGLAWEELAEDSEL